METQNGRPTSASSNIYFCRDYRFDGEIKICVRPPEIVGITDEKFHGLLQQFVENRLGEVLRFEQYANPVDLDSEMTARTIWQTLSPNYTTRNKYIWGTLTGVVYSPMSSYKHGVTVDIAYMTPENTSVAIDKNFTASGVFIPRMIILEGGGSRIIALDYCATDKEKPEV